MLCGATDVTGPATTRRGRPWGGDVRGVGGGAIANGRKYVDRARSLRDLVKRYTPEPAKQFVREVRGVGAPSSRHWCRIRMNEAIAELLEGLAPERCTAVEISGDAYAELPWREYTALHYPEFDVCTSPAPGQFDVVLCDQVLEHVVDPWAAMRTLRDLCRPEGHVIVSTPFLLRIHHEPMDYWRFTSDGLRVLLEGAGLAPVTVQQWGNRSCVQANFRTWAVRRPWHSMRDEPDFPVVVWALARRPAA